jgi:hypothetical protein
MGCEVWDVAIRREPRGDSSPPGAPAQARVLGASLLPGKPARPFARRPRAADRAAQRKLANRRAAPTLSFGVRPPFRRAPPPPVSPMAYTNPKLDRQQRGPGLVEIVLGVALSLTLGVVLGAAHLVFKPVAPAPKDPAKAPAASLLYPPVYFTEGGTSSSKGAGWKAKQQALAAGRTAEISLNEEELNAFIAAVAPPPAAPPKPPAPPAKPADPKDPKAKPAAPPFVAATLAPGVVNFRVRDSVLQAAFAGNFTALGLPLSPLVQVRGNFAKGADGFEFQPAELWLGSLPAHKVPGLANALLAKAVAAKTDVPEDLKTAWKKLGQVAVEGDALKLTLP